MHADTSAKPGVFPFPEITPCVHLDSRKISIFLHVQILERETSRRSKEIKEAPKRCASNDPQGFDNTIYGPAFQTGVLILGVLTNNAEVNVLVVGIVTVDAWIREIKASIFSL